MHRMHRIFPRDGRLAVLNIRKSARDHRRSHPLVQQPPVLIILCILCIHVQLGRAVCKIRQRDVFPEWPQEAQKHNLCLLCFL